MTVKNIHQERILIIDFGSQVTQLIARRVREIGVYCELWAYDVTEKQIKEFNPSGIILSGGPESVTEEGSPRAPKYVFKANVPVLGICYGMQTMAEQLGGKVEGSSKREYGYALVDNDDIENPLFKDIEDKNTNGISQLEVWMSHGDKVSAIPNGFKVAAHTASCPYAAMYDLDRKFFGVQFHPEVTHTVSGAKMIENFVKNICNLECLWTPDSIIEDAVKKLREKIGNEKVLLGLSGGVDSSVTAMLLHKAIGDNLTCVFVDNGLLRLNEGQQVKDMFGDKFGLNIIYVDAENRFLDALKGISDPEAKRKTIGKVFIDVFADEARKIEDVKYLAQGTIYPDVIESAASKTGKAHVIKSHHNVGGLPDDLKFSLVEPLRELFKDEVRKVGLALGLPHDMLYRHPFPGPGLGVRVLGEIKKEYCDLLRKADAIFIEELYKSNWYHKVSQAFVVFLPVRSVGVMGDGRRYDYVVSLRAVETIDFMTAHWAQLPYDLLGHVSNRIINEIDGISRVVYDVSGKPPATIEWE
jgi:GMP synthase (glutamine-hydrolysing)